MRHVKTFRLLCLLAASAAIAPAALAAPRPSLDVGALPVVRVQVTDPRVMAMEEQIRQLNGRIEELNFQILQMQDQMNKMKEDNDFRFQELEGGKKEGMAPAGPATQDTAAAPEAPKADVIVEAPAAQPTETAGATADGAAEPGVKSGAPPKILGTVTFDAKGNPSSATIEPGDAAGPTSTDGDVVAALPRSDNPEELYRSSYQFILSGDYKTAEAGFRDYAERFPSDARIADAQYWLGESLLGQERYRDAAEVFLAASKSHPKAKKAPDMLLKLGVSLAALNQRDVACATFGEIGKRYPGSSDALKGRVAQEQALAGC
ncbi:MAG: tol-pal system protein YbgF [Phyllobacteriaceae bacterium]|nr:tol-pal system protein YbgF [Phyllobacteriaceae bacterium]